MDSIRTPLSISVPIVDPKTGNPTPFFQRIMQVLLEQKATTDELAEGAVQGSRQIISGGGLTGGGDLTADRTLAVGAGTGIIVNADDVAADPEYIMDTIQSMLVAGTNITLTYDDGANTLTIDASGGGGGGSTYERTRSVPLAANFTLENAGTASMADTTYGLALTVPTVGSNIRFIRYTSGPPATPYSVIIRARPVSPLSATGLYGMCLIARNSSNGRIIICGDYNAGSHLVQRWSAYTTFSANAFGPTGGFFQSQLPWMRMRNDGTNLIFGRSPDGEEWYEFHTEPLATYITAAGGTCDQIGFGTMMNSLGSTAKMMFQSFEIA